MNKTLFWTGLGFQIVHLVSIVVLGAIWGLLQVNWTWTLIFGIIYVGLNLASLVLILLGAILPDSNKNIE